MILFISLKFRSFALLGLFYMMFGLSEFLLFSSDANAEPWLGTRFAQNCSGCHAPQRLNVKPSKRRCTLSCQGCHVNPNGGGMRSGYGKWNGNRWLKSFRSDTVKHQKNIAPFPKQFYAKKVFSGSDIQKKVARGRGVPLVEQDGPMDETKYSRAYGKEKVISESEEQFLYEIPQRDPYRLLDQSKFDGGADARWFLANGSSNVNGEKTDFSHNFLMSIDYGMRYRPVYRRFHLVYESRILGTPQKGIQKEQILSTAKTRNMYAMVDDLPYNMYIMGGYYRPLFGNYVPDHDALAQRMQANILSNSPRAQALNFNAVTIGTAPNVPYFNLHLIRNRVGDPDDKTEGFGTNFGLRFVTLGASINYSYWRTKDDRGDGNVVDVAMHSIGGGLMYEKTTIFYEAVSFTRDDTLNDFREGGVHSIDSHTKIWREVYFVFNVSSANTSDNVSKGSASQTKVGGRAFLYPGTDLTITYDLNKNNDQVKGERTDKKLVTAQFHAYF